MDNTRDYFGEKIKRLNNDVQNSQRDLHKKNVELNISLEQINQLKQEIKNIERENTKARSVIIKLKAGKIPKNPPVLLLKNIKKNVKS